VQLNITPLALVGLSLLTTPLYASEGWMDDFDEAVKIAKAEKKDLLVDFTGSDWCGWCIRLHDEVFSHEEFDAGVTPQFVLVSLDFPSGEEAKAKVPNPKRNQELQSKYGIRGFPTVLLMNSDGIVYAQTGYQEGGAEAYVKHIDELRTTGRKNLTRVTGVLEAFNTAEAGDKLEALGKLADTLTGLPAGSAFVDMLIEPVSSAFELDPKNEAGVQLRAVHALSKVNVHSAKLLAAAREYDGANTAGTLELAVRAQFTAVSDEASAMASLESLKALDKLAYKDKGVGFDLNFMAARWAAGPMANAEAAKRYATRAKELGTTDEELLDMLDQILAGDEN